MTIDELTKLEQWALEPETDGDGERIPLAWCDECNSMTAHRHECPRWLVLRALELLRDAGLNP
jgi:hypothetical protein